MSVQKWKSMHGLMRISGDYKSKGLARRKQRKYSIKRRWTDISDTHLAVSATIIPTVNLRRPTANKILILLILSSIMVSDIQLNFKIIHTNLIYHNDSAVTVHTVLCIHCKVRKKMIQVWANPIREANFKWICEGYCEQGERTFLYLAGIWKSASALFK